MSLLLQFDAATAQPVLSAIGPESRHVTSLPALRAALDADPTTHVLVVGHDVGLDVALDLASGQRLANPSVGVVLVRHRVDSSVLTQALRAGVRDVVKSDDLAALGEACERVRDLARQVHGHGEGDTSASERGKVVTVFAAKGGCGKTTMATNLAAALADGGKRRVCLVDLDLAFGDVAIAMQLTPARTLADAMHLGTTLDDAAVRSVVVSHSPGLDVVAAPPEPGASDALPATLVGDLLAVLKQSYDYVVVDSPPAFTDHVLTAFDNSDHFVLLSTLDVPALKNLKLTLDTLAMLGYSGDKYHVALNRSDAKVGLDADDVEKVLGRPIAVQVPSSRAVPSCINRGVVITLDQPGHPVSVAVRRFAQELVDTTTKPGADTQLLKSKRRISLRRRSEVAS